MLPKYQIITNTKKKWIFASYKVFREWVLKYAYLVSITLKYQFPKAMFVN